MASKRKQETAELTTPEGDEKGQVSLPPPNKKQFKEALLNLADEFQKSGGVISYEEACKLWLAACDGAGVTMKEFATLEHILATHRFTKKGRIYLDSLVTKHQSGTSMYQTIAGVRYDRSCLDLAVHLNKDGKIDLKDAELLWADVEDGPGVTLVEKRTIEHIVATYNLTDGAKAYFKRQLDAWYAAHPSSTPATTTTTTTTTAAAATTAAATTTTAAAATTATATTTSTTATTASSTPVATAAPAPAVWHGAAQTAGHKQLSRHFEFTLPAKAYGLFVDDNFVYAGDESGLVVQLNVADGVLVKQFRLPQGVKCIVADNGYLFAGCNNGSLYDLTHGHPRLVAELADFSEVLWLDIHKGQMVATDSKGNVASLNCEGETLWKAHSEGDLGWAVRVNDSGVYHGHAKGVTKYSSAGAREWTTATAAVLFGGFTGDNFFAGLIEPNCFDGEIAKRLTRAGAKSGNLVFSLMWNSRDDLDLHVITPSNEHIYFGHRKSACFGELDVDANVSGDTDEPVENIYWGVAPAGKYRVSVVQYRNRSTKPVPFELHVFNHGEKHVFKDTFATNDREKVIANVEVAASGQPENKQERLIEKSVVQITPEGKLGDVFNAGSSVPSATFNADGTQGFAAVTGAIKGFANTTQQWHLHTGAGSPMTMQCVGTRLYAVAQNKVLCFDVSPEAIAAANAGNASAGVSRVRDASIAETKAQEGSDLPVASEGQAGVRVVCVKEGAKIRVKPEAGQGFAESANIQFPRNIRTENARFLVDGLVKCGTFYRVQGNISRVA